ncbi:dTDP-4-dehydrorhamnose reductase [Granulicella tundricola]|uniref:dTDP-4-dehydrorhamnose reductase n=1 Tax=Granulicella tundricola (strain ATCC BAA-1859 / DSM 23138 / MP5ACTX9) TaxID=1198114 RepID=E8X7Q8_GRATM|nr:dTDP-4-dehydrorhamnose reductase [Granulicella tundricola]ADW71492.1 dTDP-4-dehydrorhamnose reductase [Granulicella tundricola MP5ACTX9]
MPGILITGSTGQVGGELVRLFRSQNPSLEVHAPDRSQLDLRDPASIRDVVRTLLPQWIINPAAYTAVDRAESDQEDAFAVNAEAPRILGEEAAVIGAPVLHFSTDYVFAGDAERPYEETDLAKPLGVYGLSKLAGERNLAASGAAHLIFRTSWVYGATGKNFLRTILRVARQQPQMRIVADQHGAPTAARDLAQMTATIVAQLEETAGAGDLAEAIRSIQGIYNATNSGDTTWFGFAEEALRLRRAAEPCISFAELIPIPTAEYPTPARRPASSRLSCVKLSRTFVIQMRPWQTALGEVLKEIS